VSGETDPLLLAKAAEIRRREIARLELCACCYPLIKYRNGSGHAPTCPAYKPIGGGR
jgi:hypothetical protein